MYTITDLSNLPAIFDATFAIAKGIDAINWSGEFQGLWPENEEIKGRRTLVVTYPEFVSFGRGGQKTGKILTPGTQLLEMFWDISVYVVARYAAGDDATWRGPMSAMGSIMQAFVANPTLDSTCLRTHISDPHLQEWHDKNNPAIRFFGCEVTIEAYEQVKLPET